MIHLTDKIFCVDGLPDGCSVWLDDTFNYLRFHQSINFKPVPYKNDIKLPDGKWRYCFLSSQVTEEQAAGVVETLQGDEQTGWKNYCSDDYLEKTAIESFQSLLQSKGITTHVAVLEKKL